MSDVGRIPFLDLVGLHDGLEKELTPVFQRVLKTAGFIGGPMVDQFEREFGLFCDAAHCIGVGSGTDAVRFALMAAVLPDAADADARRRRVRNSAILFSLIAAGFYLAFIVMVLVRAAK